MEINTQVKGWIDFAVKSVIVVVSVYLAMALFFMADYRKMSNLLDSSNAQIKTIDKQANFLTALYTTNNPDVLYHMAIQDEASGNVVEAVKKLTMAVQYSEYSTQQYKIKLSQLINQAHP